MRITKSKKMTAEEIRRFLFYQSRLFRVPLRMTNAQEISASKPNASIISAVTAMGGAKPMESTHGCSHSINGMDNSPHAMEKGRQTRPCIFRGISE